MQPLVKGALAVAALAAVSALVAPEARRAGAAPTAATSGTEELVAMPCGAREIPEGEACVPLPAISASAAAGAADDDDAAPPPRLPRRPDRPASVATLALPVAGEPPLLRVGADLGDDDRSVLALGAPRGTPAHAVALDGQDGPFEILAIERLPGRGLVVAALAKMTGRAAEPMVVLFGSLDGAGPGLERGSKVVDGAVIGFAGESAAMGESCVRFEARQARPGTDPRATPLAKLVSDAESVATDARNVLPKRAP